MRNPSHPGSILREDWLPYLNLSVTEFAERLRMSRPAISRILNEHASISPDLAVRLEHGGLGSARFWMSLQNAYDLWGARQNPENAIERFVFTEEAS